MNPDRLKVYYLYRCGRCGREQHRGSSAKHCNLSHPNTGKVCGGPIYQQSDVPRTLPPRIRPIMCDQCGFEECACDHL